MTRPPRNRVKFVLPKSDEEFYELVGSAGMTVTGRLATTLGRAMARAAQRGHELEAGKNVSGDTDPDPDADASAPQHPDDG